MNDFVLFELYFIRAVLLCLRYDTSPGAEAEREILFARIEEIQNAIQGR